LQQKLELLNVFQKLVFQRKQIMTTHLNFFEVIGPLGRKILGSYKAEAFFLDSCFWHFVFLNFETVEWKLKNLIGRFFICNILSNQIKEWRRYCKRLFLI
jgi:hypothetical protein